jgi:hypothetical protein
MPVVKHYVGTNADSFVLENSLSRICHELARFCKGGIRGYAPPSTFSKLLAEFPKMLDLVSRRRKPEERVVVVIDGCNQLHKENDAELMAWMPVTLPPNVRGLKCFVFPTITCSSPFSSTSRSA